jgi:hypothetical protein
LKILKVGFSQNLKWIPWMLTKINPYKYITKVFDENPHWKVQKQVFFSHPGQIRQENIKIAE